MTWRELRGKVEFDPQFKSFVEENYPFHYKQLKHFESLWGREGKLVKDSWVRLAERIAHDRQLAS